MKAGCLVRSYHDFETQRKRKRDITGNRDNILVIISTGRCDIMEVTMVMVSSEVSDCYFQISISFLSNNYSLTV